MAESYRVGGTCVIRGCVPKKLLVYAAHFHEDFEDAAGYGWTVPGPSFSWPILIANKNREISRLEGIYARLLEGSKVTVLRGRARLTGPHSVEIDGRTISAANVLVATGGWPNLPQIPGIEHCITSNEALELAVQPRRVLIVGAGKAGMTLARVYTAANPKPFSLIGFIDPPRARTCSCSLATRPIAPLATTLKSPLQELSVS